MLASYDIDTFAELSLEDILIVGFPVELGSHGQKSLLPTMDLQ